MTFRYFSYGALSAVLIEVLSEQFFAEADQIRPFHGTALVRGETDAPDHPHVNHPYIIDHFPVQKVFPRLDHGLEKPFLYCCFPDSAQRSCISSVMIKKSENSK